MSEFEKIEQEAAQRGEQELNKKLGIEGDQGQGDNQSQDQGNAPDPNQADQQDQSQQ